MFNAPHWCLVLVAITACKSASMGGSSTPAKPAASDPTAVTPNANINAGGTPGATVSTPVTGDTATTTPTTAATNATPTPNSTPVPTSATPLMGLWDAVGYTCVGGAPQIEVISVSQNATQFVGTKITGDNCVPAGYISFQGTISNGALSLNFNQGAPGSAVSLNSTAVPGTYTPTLIEIMGNGTSGPRLQLTPHHT